MSQISPYLLYEDVGRALERLAAAFGFSERLRVAGPDGMITHAEMELEGGVVMLGHPGPEYRNPAQLGQVTQLERAKSVGADIVSEPADQPYGDRRYDAKDLEGHLWSFAQRVRDVPPENWGAIEP